MLRGVSSISDLMSVWIKDQNISQIRQSIFHLFLNLFETVQRDQQLQVLYHVNEWTAGKVADLLCSNRELLFFFFLGKALASNEGPLTPARSPAQWLILSEGFLWVEQDRCVPAVKLLVYGCLCGNNNSSYPRRLAFPCCICENHHCTCPAIFITYS